MIFYFSGTGNTKWAATQIAQATGERLLYLPDVMDVHDYSLAEGERVGFCFPVHGWRPPVLLRKFISQLRVADPVGHYVFALCTAGDNIGETMYILESDLASVGLHVDSAFSLIMPESYVGLPFMDVDKPASHCPVHDIDGGEGKMPRWLHNGDCLTCFSCYHHCPEKAIAFGSMTRNKGQYYYERNTKRNNK